MIAMHQLAGLGIRHKLVRHVAWVGASVFAAVLAVTSVALAVLPYVLLIGFAVWRLAVRR